MRIRRWTGSAGVVFAVLLLGGCADSPSPVAPSATGPMTTALDGVLSRALQDEYRAETIYQGVIDDFGPVLPFVNVLTAEMRHSASIVRLYEARGVVAPAGAWRVDGVPHFATIVAACLAGAAAERENIALYDDVLRSDLPPDVRQVFTNNRLASLNNHLPAFERCSS